MYYFSIYYLLLKTYTTDNLPPTSAQPNSKS